MKIKKTICCRGELIDLQTPKVMGIINITPDSFYQQSRTSLSQVCQKVEQMLLQGADFIDIGGYSSRPGANEVTQEQELERVIPVIDQLIREFPKIYLSIDTFRSKVAQRAIEAGACMINDISAGEIEPEIWQVAQKYQVPYIAMHMRGTPQTMQDYTNYKNIIQELIFYFSEKKQKARELGLTDLIIDPGFGFSKTLSQNYELMQKLDQFQILDQPLLVGISRKSMIYNVLNTDSKEALSGTIALNTIALCKGANILRVHDVKPAKDCIEIVQNFNSNKQ